MKKQYLKNFLSWLQIPGKLALNLETLIGKELANKALFVSNNEKPNPNYNDWGFKLSLIS